MEITKTDKIASVILGSILIITLVGNTFNDVSSELSYANEEYSGGKLIKIFGLVFAIGIVYLLYKVVLKK